MSYTNEELRTIEDLHADFDMAISEGKWSEARSIIDNMGDLGYEQEALYMHKSYNRAYSEADVVYVPVEDEIPTITPEEDDAPILNGYQHPYGAASREQARSNEEHRNDQ